MALNNGSVTGLDILKFGTGKTWDATATIATDAQTVSCPGVRLGDVVTVVKPTEQTGLGVTGARVSADDELTIIFVNPTAGNLTATAEEEWIACVVRAPLPHGVQVTI